MLGSMTVDWLVDAAAWFAVAMLAVSMVFGATLLLVPTPALRAADFLNRRFSGRKALRPMEIPRASERFFYRYHRITGLMLLAGVGIFFLLYFYEFPRDMIVAKLARNVSAPLAGMAIDVLEYFFVAMNAVIGVMAVVVLVRPSALKPLEAFLNRWYSTRRALRGADEQRESLDEFVKRFPRTSGLLILCGSLYISASFVVAFQ